ncbi:MAG: hypothetical protein OHM56_12730 [Spiroplasma phoeniceum]|nr:MAG: hypothetical protein OHM57_12165 [Spiroplasma phoeniceum]UZQ32362.1 MAG: hypothetical protein OHM56_12730 [Spiroplasma phoeniceum]
MINLNTYAIIDLPLPVLIVFVVIFVEDNYIKHAIMLKIIILQLNRRQQFGLLFKKNKYLILFLLCFFCLIGSILVLVKQLVGFPLF